MLINCKYEFLTLNHQLKSNGSFVYHTRTLNNFCYSICKVFLYLAKHITYILANKYSLKRNDNLFEMEEY